MLAPCLQVASGPDQNTQFPLKPGKHVLGRHADAAYRLSDPRVSRMHCEVEWADGRVTLTDNGSAAGTLVNGAAVTDSAVLRAGDTVHIGDSVLRVVSGTGETATLKPGLGAAADLDPTAVEELAELSGRTLVRYAIGRPLGRGTTSMVFQATASDGSALALKVMHPDYAKDPDEVQRFVRAMKSTAGFQHPNIVRTLAAGKDGPYCWVALELVDGESLTEVIKRIGVANMLDWKYAFRVGLHVGRALAYAHAQGVIHRDITPANILIESSTRRAKLADLMLAKALDGAQAKQITRPGQMVGDVNYMSPERTGGGTTAVDARSDLFSLGATCYALLCGKPPFAGTNLIDTLTKVRTTDPVPPSKFQMGIPQSFEFAVLKLLAKRPDDRYQTAADWVKELERIGKPNGAPLD